MEHNPVVETIAEDPLYFAKRQSIYAVGKQVVHAVDGPVSETIGSVSDMITPEAMRTTSAILPGLGSSAPILVGIGMTAAISAGLTQMDYHHKRDRLKESYREELAAKLKKPIDKVTTADLDTLAKNNRVFSEELKKTSRQRNFGVVLSFIASMASLAVVSAFSHAYLPGLTEGLEGAMQGIAEFGLRSIVAVSTYLATKTPLHWLGDKLFDLHEHTAHDKIVSIKRAREQGKSVSREQILSVFAEANPQLEEFIRAEYGNSFDRMSAPQRAKVAADLSKMIPLDTLAQDINSGKVNVGELAFAVQDDISGVNHEISRPPAERKGFFSKIAEKVTGVFERPHDRVTEVIPSPSFAIPNKVLHTPREDVPAQAAAPERSFVQQIGARASVKAQGFAAQEDLRRMQAQAAAIIQQT